MCRRKQNLAQILTPLVVNLFIRPRYGRGTRTPFLQRNRVAVFASYSHDGILPPQVIPYLEGLKSVATTTVVVCDNELQPGEAAKLYGRAAHVITGRHGEYDFGSYKRGTSWLRENGYLEAADDLILCNDSCYGPTGSFGPMFAEMESRDSDFWGATESHEIQYHLQSYFVVLTRKSFKSSAFEKFIDGVKKEKTVQDVIKKYEIGLTKCLVAGNLKPDAFISNIFMGTSHKDPTYKNLTFVPNFKLKKGLPLIKVKALHKSSTNVNGSNTTIDWMRINAPELFEAAQSNALIRKMSGAENIRFSVIMPAYNRKWCISRAVNAALAQTHQNFEIIIVDDGSSDGTENELREKFHDEITSGKIVYVPLPRNGGVSRARNVGLSFATSEWVTYADSDNEMRPYFLSMMANSIMANPDKDTVYGRMINVNSGLIVGKPFEQGDIVKGNFIDLGVFAHRRSLVSRYGGFDDSLRRLVDWDLIVRYTRHKDPAYIDRIILDYVDDERNDRISVKESYLKADIQIRRKHSPSPTVSTVIVSYNHQNFIVEAIESALAQRGDFYHEILLSDDGSRDSTTRIFRSYADRYPKRIRNISRGENRGISENYRHCFAEAQGEFIAVLEGDDYWTDPEKNLKQAMFLRETPAAAMVMSRIELLDMSSGGRRLLRRQEGLAKILSGADFAENEHLNLIANFSSTMFRSDIVKTLPDAVYHPRLNEITLAFYLEQIGGIGFIPEVMSTYRLNEKSVWTGASALSRHMQAIEIRKAALRLARPVYRQVIQSHIDARQKLMESELAKETQVA